MEKQPLPGTKACGGGLTPSSVKQLELLGLSLDCFDEKLRIEGAEIINESKRITFKLSQLGLNPPFGYTVRRQQFDKWLLHHAIEAGAVYYGRTRAVAFNRCEGENRIEVIAENGRSFTCHWLVVADGGRSEISRAVFRGISFNQRYRVTGFAARRYLEVEEHSLPSAFSFISSKNIFPALGWAFPLSDGELNIGAGILARHRGKSQRLTAIVDSLEKYLIEAGLISGVLGRSRTASSPIFAGGMRSGHGLSAENIIPVGEAAGLVNPLTGEGINFALESARYCAEAVIKGGGISWYFGKLGPALGFLTKASRVVHVISSSYRLTSAVIGRVSADNPLGSRLARFWIGT